MDEKRIGKRIQHKGFKKFDVTLTIKNISVKGHPGDISETGMSLLVIGDEKLDLPIGSMAFVKIQSLHLHTPFESPITIVREQKIKIQNKEYNLVGLAFPDNTVLPDAIIAIDMMDD